MLFPRAQIVAERLLPADRGSILLPLESPCQEGTRSDLHELQDAWLRHSIDTDAGDRLTLKMD
jgi:hypothetical protein